MVFYHTQRLASHTRYATHKWVVYWVFLTDFIKRKELSISRNCFFVYVKCFVATNVLRCFYFETDSKTKFVEMFKNRSYDQIATFLWALHLYIGKSLWVLRNLSYHIVMVQFWVRVNFKKILKLVFNYFARTTFIFLIRILQSYGCLDCNSCVICLKFCSITVT